MLWQYRARYTHLRKGRNVRDYLTVQGNINTNYLIDTEGNVYTADGKPLTQFQSHNGYMRVKLSKGIERKMYLVHRLVADTFLENPYNYPIVHHKDGNRENNSVSNLEWCNNSHNQKERFIGIRGTKAKPVLQFTLSGEFVKEWETPKEVFEQTGIQSQNISKVCKGIRRQAGGYVWAYKQ